LHQKNNNGTVLRSQHQHLPSIIPRLSDVMEGVTMEEFSIETTPARTPIRNASPPQRSDQAVVTPRRNQKRNDDSTKKIEQSPKDDNGKSKQELSIAASSKRNRPPNDPWRASFKASLRTQGRIKKALEIDQATPVQRATAVLQALLTTPPTQCNAANVVCALTFSAKAMTQHRSTQQQQDNQDTKEFRSLLFRTIGILNELVSDNILTARQLCNAVWAIAKHYDRDASLLPPPLEQVAMSSENVIGVAETWSLSDGGEKVHRKRVDETVDEIAKQLTAELEESNGKRSTDPHYQPAKTGEICMATWAYGILRPRRRPPGWHYAPQLGRLPGAAVAEKPPSKSKNQITFEQWTPFKSDKVKRPKIVLDEIADKLFDAISLALCRSPEYVSEAGEDGHRRASTNLEQCTWSELANLGWAFASHGSCKSVESEMLLLGIAREASYRLREGGDAAKQFLTRDIAQLIWALGTLQADNYKLAEDLVHLVEALSDSLRLGDRGPAFSRGRPLRRWSCADLVQTALSLAHARINELPLLRAVYEESNHRLSGLQTSSQQQNGERRSLYAWEVSILLWAQARLHLKTPQGPEFDDFVMDAPKYILKALAGTRSSLQDIGVGPQEQANIAWALTVLEEHQSPNSIALIDRIFLEAAQACEEKQVIQLEHAHQLWQSYFLLEEESPEAVENVPAWFCDYLRDKWNVEKAREKISSARHRALSKTLQLMGVWHYNEHDEDIDVAIVLKGNAAWTHETETGEEESIDRLSVAVEFDGPNHFTREQGPIGNQRAIPPRALGHTVLKYRLLKKQGWSVVRVPYFEFDKIPFWASMVGSHSPRNFVSCLSKSPHLQFLLFSIVQERQRYIQRKLKTHANINFSQVDVSEYKALAPNRKSRFD
jgi:hypothetical protein